MANLITGEWKKLFQWKFLLILLPLVFLLNGVLLSNQITRDFDENQNIDRWIINEAEPVSYVDFLQSIDEQAEKMQDAAVFNGSYFNRESLEKTRSVYSRLHGIRPETDYPTGMRYVTDYHMTDVFLFLTVIALLIRLMLQERAEGLLHLIKPTKNGRVSDISYCGVFACCLILWNQLSCGRRHGSVGKGRCCHPVIGRIYGKPFRNQHQYIFLSVSSL